jgi:hypothetical protein
MMDFGQPVAVAMKEIEAWVRTNIQGRVFDSDHELRKTMVEVGCIAVPKRIKTGGRLQYVVINPTLHLSLANASEADYIAGVRAKLKRPSELIAEDM